MYPENDSQYWEDEISKVGSDNFSVKKGGYSFYMPKGSNFVPPYSNIKEFSKRMK